MDTQVRQLWRNFQRGTCPVDLLGNTFLRSNILIDPEELLRKESLEKHEVESRIVGYYPLLPTTMSFSWRLGSINTSWQAWIDEYRTDNIAENWLKCRSPETMLHIISRNEGLSHRLLLATHALLPSIMNQHNPYPAQSEPFRDDEFIVVDTGVVARSLFDSFSALAAGDVYSFMLNQYNDNKDLAIERANIIRRIIPLPTRDPSYFQKESHGT